MATARTENHEAKNEALLFERRADGSILFEPSEELRPYSKCLTDRLPYWAEKAPDRIFLAERASEDGWKTLTFAEAWDRCQRVAQGLLERGATAERPVVILSGNSVEHGLLQLACMHIGVPAAPVSPAYSLLSSDFAQLRDIVSLLRPRLIYAADGTSFGRALQAVAPREAHIVVGRNPVAFASCELLEALEQRAASEQVEREHEKVGLDTIAKLLFTSGSTGRPKGVINTQRMLCSNQQSILQRLKFLATEPPVLVDWLAWHHTFGGNHNLGLVLNNGGTLYIDWGKPIGGAVQETVRNLREIAPTIYVNVPKGYELLIPILRADPRFRDHFFSRMKMIFYGAAAMSAHTWDALCELSRESRGFIVPLIAGMGSTETAPGVCYTSGNEGRPGFLGFPLAGVRIKLAPIGPKMEMRVKGPNVTPGYWQDAEKTKAAFDEEGFYRMGDAVRLTDPDDPGKGIEFDGRIAEDFKLSSGTWVNVGPLRLRILEVGAPLVRDVVIAGQDRDYLSALIVPDVEACGRHCVGLGDGANADAGASAGTGEILMSAGVRAEFQKILEALAAESTGTSNRIVRAILLEEPLSADAGEVTDKGSINQRAVIDRRAALVEECYEAGISPRVFEVRAPR